MAYLAPIHRPTSVRHALKLELVAADVECLVLAKANRLEIYSQTSDGLVMVHTRNVYGIVTMLEKLRPAHSMTDHLFVGTDRYMYFTVSWDAQTRQLITEKSYVNQADKSLRDSQTQSRCLTDPAKRFMALLLYDGIVTVLPIIQRSNRKGLLEAGALGDPVGARISDFFVRSATFLYAREKDGEETNIAFLYENNEQKLCLSVRNLDYTAGGSGDHGSADLENVLAVRDDIELGASHLIPVPAPAYGLLVLAQTRISYANHVSGQDFTKSLDEATQFVAWTPVDDQRWLIGDDFGRLFLLMLSLEDGDEVTGWNLDLVGQTSRASVLVYLDGGYVFVGSHQGESMVVKIEQRGIETVQQISNIAPVLDFAIMDLGSRSGEGQTNEYSSGQARIVTGSGSFQDGTLRSVRSGVGLEEQGVLGEMKHATNIFALRPPSSTECSDILVVSFVGETRIFQFLVDGEVEEQADYKSFIMSEGTILASSLENSRLLQITGSSARLIDSENDMVVSAWAPPTGLPITAASANERSIALSVGGVEAVVLDIRRDLEVRAKRKFPEAGQIACIHVSFISSDICIAGFWQNAAVEILKIDTLETIHKTVVSDDGISVPRSIVLTQILAEQSPTMFVAMANGEVISFSVDLSNFALSMKKVVILGTQQANLTILPRGDGLSNVFATCEHSSLIYGSQGRIVYSAVTAENATSICSFDSKAYPGAIAIATSDDIRIALVDTERTTHVRTLQVGETVRRIAYSPRLKAFGIGTINRSLHGLQEIVRSHFKLTDEVLFKELDTYALDEEELVESVIRADIREDDGDLVERFIVGTAYVDGDEQESIRGRIIVFAVTTERTLRIITELPVKGACRALAAIHGNIVAALVKSIVVYALRASHLTSLTSHRTSTAPIALSAHTPSSTIAMADLMKSLSIITYKPHPSPGLSPTLTETARHFQTIWSTAVARVGDKTWLQADAEGNLMVLHQNTAGVTEDDRRRLEVLSEIRLGEMVNTIREVDVAATAHSAVVPKAFVATVEGGVYLFGMIGDEWLDLLMRLQAAMASLVVGLGGLTFDTYRAFRNEVREAEEPWRFVDGELIEGFLGLEGGLQEKIVEELGEVARVKGGVEGVKEVIEVLRRLH